MSKLPTPSSIAAVQKTLAFTKLEAAKEAVRRNPTAENVKALQDAWAAWADLAGVAVSNPDRRTGWLRRAAGPCAMAMALVVSLSACAVHTWAPPPGGSPLTFDQQAAQCRLYARGNTPGGPGFVAASGKPAFVGAFVGGVMLASAITQAVANQQNFNDCMQAVGWVATDVHQ
jgi:hypothetical protein